MAVVVRVENSDGVVGQCDAKCYDAEGGRCSCICGGANHGQGLTMALAKGRELAEVVGKRSTSARVTSDARTAQTVLAGVLD